MQVFSFLSIFNSEPVIVLGGGGYFPVFNPYKNAVLHHKPRSHVQPAMNFSLLQLFRENK